MQTHLFGGIQLYVCKPDMESSEKEILLALLFLLCDFLIGTD